MLEYIKIYKQFHITSETSQLVNDCELSMYTIHNFDKYYNSISKLNNIKSWCEDNDIFTLKKYIKILHDNIRGLRHIFNGLKLNYYDDIGYTHITSFLNLDVKKKYLSIDLKHAYSQLIDSMHIFDSNFDDIIFDNLPNFMRESKRARIFMYSQIPKHENILQYTYKLFDKLFESDHKILQYLKKYNLNPISYNVDELIYDITETPDLFNEFVGEHTINNINIHLNIFEQHYITYIDPFTNKEKTIPIREYATHTNFVTRTCPYMNQLYKAYNNLPVIENDLYIPNKYDWNKIDKLNEPIKIVDIK